jgi:integrase
LAWRSSPQPERSRCADGGSGEATRTADGARPPSDTLAADRPSARSRRRVALSARALAALDALPARLSTPLLFPAPSGGYIGLDTWRTREWYPALEAAGIGKRGPYHLRHTFASEALAASVSTFELSRLMGTSIAMIDRTYGHLARDSEEGIRARLDARDGRSGVEMASASPQ